MATQEPKHPELPPDLALLLDALRSEFNAKLTSLKLQGILALTAGGTIGGLISRIAFPTQTSRVLGHIARLFI